MSDYMTKLVCEEAEKVGALRAENDLLRAALRSAEKAIDDCLECRCHINYAALKVVRAALAFPMLKPGTDAEPATSVQPSRGLDQVGRTGGSIPPTGATVTTTERTA